VSALCCSHGRGSQVAKARSMAGLDRFACRGPPGAALHLYGSSFVRTLTGTRVGVVLRDGYGWMQTSAHQLYQLAAAGLPCRTNEGTNRNGRTNERDCRAWPTNNKHTSYSTAQCATAQCAQDTETLPGLPVSCSCINQSIGQLSFIVHLDMDIHYMSR
jgi:hypothetical protein